ncbi:MAG: translation factor Sua5, partial [Proteobacteria bacterium]|nr:translation factor Sua5 [Pseudomonadota bacterium]
ASGTLPAHYAPATPLRLYPAAELWRHASALAEQGLRILIITWSDSSRSRPALSESIEQLIMPSDPAAYGQQLYARLRQFDQLDFDYLLAETPPDHPDWLAITDRLQRASYH